MVWYGEMKWMYEYGRIVRIDEMEGWMWIDSMDG
jgi:hypothetical protein